MRFQFIALRHVPIIEQLKWEEALLRADKRNWCLINIGSPPAIVMGISGQFDQLIHKDKWSLNQLPVIRRFTGGGTVVIDPKTIFVTLICNTQEAKLQPYPHSITKWAESLYIPFFKDLPFSLRENDYTLGEKKIAGNAMSIIKERWLLHSSFLFQFDQSLMDLLLLPAKAPAYRQKRCHAEFLTSLHPHWQSTEDFMGEWVHYFKEQFEVKESCIEELEKIRSLPHRKATCYEKNCE